MDLHESNDFAQRLSEDVWKRETGDCLVREDVNNLIEEEPIQIVESAHKVRVLISLFKSLALLASDE